MNDLGTLKSDGKKLHSNCIFIWVGGAKILLEKNNAPFANFLTTARILHECTPINFVFAGCLTEVTQGPNSTIF